VRLALVTLCRTSYGEAFCPLRVRLQRPRPPCEQQFDAFFRAPIVYDAPDTRWCLRLPIWIVCCPPQRRIGAHGRRGDSCVISRVSIVKMW